MDKYKSIRSKMTSPENTNEIVKYTAVMFAEWLKHIDNGTTHYNPNTGMLSPSIGFSPNDCFNDNIKPVDELFDYWINNVYENTINNAS